MDNGLIIVLILPLLFFICAWIYAASEIRKELGPLKDKEFSTYWENAPRGEPVTNFFAYPFWLILSAFDEPPPPPPPPPPEPVIPTFEEWATPVLDDFTVRLPQRVSNLAPATIEDAVAAARELLKWEYDKTYNKLTLVTPQPNGPLLNAFTHLLKNIPLRTDFNSCLAVQLYEIVSKDQLDHFFRELSPNEEFKEVRSQYLRDADWGFALTGGAPGLLRKMSTEPIGVRNSPEHMQRNLARFPYLREIIIPIALPKAARFEGTWAIAPQGRGKTTLLSCLLYDDVIAVSKGKACVIVMGSKGDLVDHLRQVKGFAPGQPLDGGLTLIEPSANLAINPLDLGATAGHTLALLEYVFSALLDSQMTALQGTLFRSILIALGVIPNANFATFRDFLLNGWEPYEQHIRTLHPEDADFFINGEYDSKTYTSTKTELLWRIRDLTTRVPMLRDMFRATKTKIDMGKLMDTPGYVLIDNSIAHLTEHGSEFFSRFFIALILGAAQQRSHRRPEDKLPVYVYIDEAQTVIAKDPTIATIIQTCRSQNIGLVLAHQALSQIKLPEVRSALEDCAIRFANSDSDASELAESFRTDAAFLKGMEKGQFALFVRDQLRQPIRVTVRNLPVSSWPKMADEELAKIRLDMRERYGWTPAPTAPIAPTPTTPTEPTATKPTSRPPAPQPPRDEPEDSTPKKWKRK